MTAYVVAAGIQNVALFPGSFEVRIAQIQYTGADQNDAGGTLVGLCYAYAYSGGATGSGTVTSITPEPLRQGASASTATGKYAVSFTGSGTYTPLFFQVAGGPGSTSYANPNIPEYSSSVAATFTPPFDLILSPGSALITQNVFGGSVATYIYFEELRLSWPY
jgi:hypothetical protein